MGLEKLPQRPLIMVEKEGIIEESLITCILFHTFTNKLLEWMNAALSGCHLLIALAQEHLLSGNDS